MSQKNIFRKRAGRVMENSIQDNGMEDNRVSKSRKSYLRIAADLYKGMPEAKIEDQYGRDVKLEPLVELKAGEHFNVKLEMSERMAKKMANRIGEGKVSISLNALDVELQHNQSFGMVAASTGCISNPGGPGC